MHISPRVCECAAMHC